MLLSGLSKFISASIQCCRNPILCSRMGGMITVQSSSVVGVMNRWGVRINTRKTKTQVIQPCKAEKYYTSEIKAQEETIEQVRNFSYLGTVISEDASLEEEIENRIGRACAGMRKFRDLWKDKAITRKTKRHPRSLYSTNSTICELNVGAYTNPASETQPRLYKIHQNIFRHTMGQERQ